MAFYIVYCKNALGLPWNTLDKVIAMFTAQAIEAFINRPNTNSYLDDA